MKTRTLAIAALIFLPVLKISADADHQTHQQVIGNPIAEGGFELLREPSGVIALDEKTLLVVEDETHTALRRLSITSGNLADFAFEEFDQPAAKGFIQRQLLNPLDDLEGIARLTADRFFIISSHEDANLGTRPEREKIVLLTRENTDIVSASMRLDLFDQIEKQYPSITEFFGKKKNSLNIEGLALDRKRQHLLIGLRSPLANERAIVVELRNPVDYLEGAEPEFAQQLHFIDLDNSGIRAMSYDDTTDTFLIIARGESKGNKLSRLWVLEAEGLQSPVKFDSDDENLFENVEGLTPIGEGVLFVRDSGGKKNRDDAWFILKRTQIGLDSTPQ